MLVPNPLYNEINFIIELFPDLTVNENTYFGDTYFHYVDDKIHII